MTRRELDLAKLKSATPWPVLQETIRLQLGGLLVFLGAGSAAETLACVLGESSSWAVLWYVNLEVFSIFRKSRVALFGYISLPFAQLLIISPLAFLALAGIALRRNLLIAVSSNLTLVCAGFLLFSWHH